jgi:hypothetical protein
LSKQGKRILAILAVLALAFTVLAGCGKDETTGGAGNFTIEETLSGEQVIPTFPPVIEDTEPVTESSDVTEDITETATGSDTQAVSTSGSSTLTQPGAKTVVGTTTKVATTAVSGDAAILAYFNAAVNNVKIQKPGYTWKERTLIDRDSIETSSSAINSVKGAVIGLFSAFEKWTDKDAVAAGADHNDFPVSGKPWASKLTMADIKSISSTDGGSVYNIQINLKDENLSAPPVDRETTAHGRVMNIWTKEAIDAGLKSAEAFVGIDKFAPQYSGSYVKCTIDKTTGALKTITYFSSANTKLHINKVLAKADIDASIRIGSESAYIIG